MCLSYLLTPLIYTSTVKTSHWDTSKIIKIDFVSCLMISASCRRQNNSRLPIFKTITKITQTHSPASAWQKLSEKVKEAEKGVRIESRRRRVSGTPVGATALPAPALLLHCSCSPSVALRQLGRSDLPDSPRNA